MSECPGGREVRPALLFLEMAAEALPCQHDMGTILRLKLPGEALDLFSVPEEKLFHLSIRREQVDYLVFQHPAGDDAQGGHGWFGLGRAGYIKISGFQRSNWATSFQTWK